jgi:hypothetical protein
VRAAFVFARSWSLSGGSGIDHLFGGDSGDDLFGGGSNDTLDGGDRDGSKAAAATTTSTAEGSTQPASAAAMSLLRLQFAARQRRPQPPHPAGRAGRKENDTIRNVEDVESSRLRDHLTATSNHVFGLDGSDALESNSGIDVLFGGDGAGRTLLPSPRTIAGCFSTASSQHGLRRARTLRRGSARPDGPRARAATWSTTAVSSRALTTDPGAPYSSARDLAWAISALASAAPPQLWLVAQWEPDPTKTKVLARLQLTSAVELDDQRKRHSVEPVARDA